MQLFINIYLFVKNNIYIFIEKNKNITEIIYDKTKKYTINNKFSMFSENMLSTYSGLSKINTKILVFLPILFVNYVNINFYMKRMINALFIIYIYNNKTYYIDKFLNFIFYTKILLDSIYLTYFKVVKKDFILNKVLLYTDLTNNYNVISYFNGRNINVIDKNLYNDICIENKINITDECCDDCCDLRLKLFFTYKDSNYILYFSYNNDNHIPYPPYTSEIIQDYRSNIVLPNYNNKKKIYALFNIDSKNISSIQINDVQNDNIVDYINKIRTPFNDFGLLYNPVKLSWLLSENNIDISTFSTFTLKFLNLYFDEVKMDLVDHYIKMDKYDLDKIIISDKMREILF